MSDQGIPFIQQHAKAMKFKGKGFEVLFFTERDMKWQEEDLQKFICFYMSWANRLAPKLTFEAFLDKVNMKYLLFRIISAG